MRLHELRDVFTMQLAELRSVETQLIDALPRLAASSHDGTLRDALLRHHEQTRRHRLRLDVVIRDVEGEAEVSDRESEPMRSLVRDALEVASCDGPGDVRDVALVAAVRQIEQFEVASYASAGMLARSLCYRNAERSFHTTLGEEREAGDLLARLADVGVLRRVGDLRQAGLAASRAADSSTIATRDRAR